MAGAAAAGAPRAEVGAPEGGAVVKEDEDGFVTRSPEPTAKEAQYLADYACELGRLLGNVSSLEMLLRFALYAADTLPAKRLPDGWQASTLPVKRPLPVNWLTNWCVATGNPNRRQTTRRAAHARASSPGASCGPTTRSASKRCCQMPKLW
jgi:hypothetical protein